MNIGNEGNIYQNDKRQNDDEQQNQTGYHRGRITPPAQVDNIWSVAAACDRDVAFGSGGQATVKINKDHGDKQQRDGVNDGQILGSQTNNDSITVNFVCE